MILANSAHQADIHTSRLIAHLQPLGLRQFVSWFISNPSQKVFCFFSGSGVRFYRESGLVVILGDSHFQPMSITVSVASYHLSLSVPAATGSHGLCDSSDASGLADDRKMPALGASQTDVLLPSERREGMGHSIVPMCSAPLERLSGSEPCRLDPCIMVITDASTWGWRGICRNIHVKGAYLDEERT